MIDRPLSLTIHLSAEEMALLTKGAQKINGLIAEGHPPGFPAPVDLTPAHLVVMVVEKTHSEFLDAMQP